jgi:FkbM family methyltransferase
VVFDVGANVGNYSKKLRKSNPEVDIFCFEPHPVNFKALKTNASNLNLKLFQCGVGSSTGVLNLYDYADDDGSSHASFYKDVIEEIHNRKAVGHQVNIIALDQFVEQNGIDRVSLLKIDTEGHEMEVLKGFERWIRAGKVDLIHFEFNEMNVVSRVFFKDFWDFLPNYNFYRMLPHGLLPIRNYSPISCEIFAYQNIVASLKT